VEAPLEQLDVGKHARVEGYWNVVVRRLEIRPHGVFQRRGGGWSAKGGRKGEQFVDGRRLVFLLGKPVARRKGPHFIGADPIDETVEMLADPRFGPAAVGRLQQNVDRAIELLFRRLDVPLFELGLAGFEVPFGGANEREDRIFDHHGDRLRKRRGSSHRRCRCHDEGLRPPAGPTRGNERNQREWKQALPLKSVHSGRSAIANRPARLPALAS
jgi:hypothetical protein